MGFPTPPAGTPHTRVGRAPCGAGYTNTAIGFACGKLVGMILRDTREVAPVSTNVRTVLDLDDNVFVSVPCVVGRGGVVRVMSLDLPDIEKARLMDSVRAVLANEKALKLEEELETRKRMASANASGADGAALAVGGA